jgi:hypothetical protein
MYMESVLETFRWLFDSRRGPRSGFLARWLFLRALGAIYFSAFLALVFQIKGLIGPNGIEPAGQYLAAVGRAFGTWKVWEAPSLFWFSSGSSMMTLVAWLGLLAAIAAFLNLWPRLSFLICFVCFLSFVTAANDFSGYQSDGMLLEAGFLALFFCPPGLRPGLAADHPPARASLFLLLWEWFRIYFESGMVKMLSGDPQWRNLTAMHEYYQNGPLPTWIGWYIGHFPHWFHVTTTAGTLLLEFGIVLLLFFGRRARLICFLIVTPWEFGVIFTANYAFLNYLVLSLGFLLLDDRYLRRIVPARFAARFLSQPGQVKLSGEEPDPSELTETPAWRNRLSSIKFSIATVMLAWIAYATTYEMAAMVMPMIPLPAGPASALQPSRIANQYGLFAVMTRARYEIEFQGSDDGHDWQPYIFRFKPQALNEAPGIYAPYQPRFDWNLWFASLADPEQDNIVPATEAHLLDNDPDVLSLFRENPFAAKPLRFIRAVRWQYWFTSMEEKGRTGNWWRREEIGLYGNVYTRDADGQVIVADPASM